MRSGGLKAVALALLLSGVALAEARSTPAPVAPAAAPFRLGALQLFALHDADNVVANDGKTFGVGVPTEQVAAVLSSAGAPPDPITLSVDALLVKTPGRVMLFDTGLGPPAHGVLIQSLQQAGVAPDAVSDIFITHSHPDHVGGLLTPDGRLAFPNAVVHLSAREWASMQANPRAARTVAVIAPRVRPFEPGEALAPGVTSIALYGHTPGHVGYRITSEGRTLVDMGDTAHSSIVSLAHPEWIIEYDADAQVGRATRAAALARLAQSGTLVFAPHFPFPGVGRIVKAGDAYAWRPGLP